MAAQMFCFLPGVSSWADPAPDISEISAEQREVLTPFNCWAPVMCWKTLSISCSMRLAQCIILWRHITACHNTCKRTCPTPCEICRLSSSNICLRTKYSHCSQLTPTDGTRSHGICLLDTVKNTSICQVMVFFWLLWNWWLVCLCSNCWMSFKL